MKPKKDNVRTLLTIDKIVGKKRNFSPLLLRRTLKKKPIIVLAP